MSELGDLLELLHGARGRVSTVRATVRTWRHGERLSAALGRGGRVAYAPLEDAPPVVEGVRRVWLDPPDRAREEREGADGEGYGVRRGSRWWHYHPDGGAISGDGDRGGVADELWWLLDPASVMGFLEFGTPAPGRRAGRETLRVRAVPRSRGDDNEPLFRLGALGADELLLELDAERGTPLRIETRLGGEPLTVAEVTEIAFDEVFGDELFTFVPPPDEAVRPAGGELGIVPDLTIEEAVARAPFTVWVPARVPAGWDLRVAFAPEHRGAAPHVFLRYRSADGTHGVTITESPASRDADPELEGHPGGRRRAAERGGRRMELRDPAEPWQDAVVRLELDGTQVRVESGDLTADWLADLAGGLRAASADPPSLDG